MNGLFIAGTDRGVGKTYVTVALLKDLRQRGIPALGCKPVCCGDRAEARAMREVTDATLSLDSINPVYLRAAAAPLVAAELERKPVDTRALAEHCAGLLDGSAPVLVEAPGGWETPIAFGYSTADLAQQLALPVLLVIENKQGAESLAVMTVNAIRSRGLECCAIVLNHIGEEWDTASVTNRGLIEDLTGVPVVAELIHGQEDMDSASVPGMGEA